jgi:tetratricopeptide (TPR) repeat protein
VQGERGLRTGLATSILLAVGIFTGCSSGDAPLPSSAKLYLDAQTLLAAGDKAAAMEALNASIDAEPTPWALLMRAKLLLDAGDEAGALKDCNAGLEVAPDDASLAWLKGELAKPAASRFQGKFKDPPTRAR